MYSKFRYRQSVYHKIELYPAYWIFVGLHWKSKMAIKIKLFYSREKLKTRSNIPIYGLIRKNELYIFFCFVVLSIFPSNRPSEMIRLGYFLFRTYQCYNDLKKRKKKLNLLELMLLYFLTKLLELSFEFDAEKNVIAKSFY